MVLASRVLEVDRRNWFETSTTKCELIPAYMIIADDCVMFLLLPNRDVTPMTQRRPDNTASMPQQVMKRSFRKQQWARQANAIPAKTAVKAEVQRASLRPLMACSPGMT